MRKTELIVSGEVIYPKTKASIVDHEHTNIEECLDQQNRTSSTITQSASTSKVGLGDDVDLSFCVEDGFYEGATFYGKTLVNRIQEPSSQDVVLPYEFEDGQYVTINDTKESGALGIELKGRTLVNMAKNKSCDKSNAVGEVNISAKPNTTYIAFFDGTYDKEATAVNFAMFCTSPVYVENTTGLNGDGLYTATVNGHGGNEHRWNPSLNYTKFTTSSNQNYIHIRTGGGKTNIKYDNMRIFEYQDGMENWDIPYFIGMASCKMPTLHTVGKNLFDLTNAPNGYLTTNNPYALASPDYNNKTSAYIKVKPNTKYSYSFDGFTPSQVGNMYWTGFYYYKRIGEVSTAHPSRMTFTSNSEANKQITFTTPSDCNYIRIGSRGLMLDGATVQLEEATSATTYEQHKSSILSLPEEVVLRSLPNGVCDTFNTRTGVYTRRIGERVLDGTYNWSSYREDSHTDDEWYQATVYGLRIAKDFELNMICDKLKAINNLVSVNTSPQECITNYRDEAGGYTDGNAVFVCVKKATIGATTITECRTKFQQWIINNPLTIQYKLETPIVTKINLPSTLKSWNTTTHIYSEIPENSLYPTLSHSNPSYPVILKPSTKYSIVANSYSNGHTNSAINFNLGGATASTTVGNRVTTITTPSTLTSEELVMSGRGNKLNNVMVIEGDVVGDEPYFEGICDCKSPILSNVGKNLFDASYVGNYEHWERDTGVAFNNYPYVRIQLKQNTNYVFTRNDTNNPSKTGRRSHIIVHTLENKNSGEWLYHHESPSLNQKEIKINTSSSGVLIFANSTCGSQTDLTDMMAGFSKSMIEESSSATSYEQYKSNILSCNGDKIELTEDMFEEGGIGGYAGHLGKTYEELKTLFPPSLSGKRLMTVDLVKVKPNTSYNINSSDNFAYLVCSFNANKIANGGTDTGYVKSAIFTTSSDTHYVAVIVKRDNDGSISMLDFKNANFTLSEVDKTIVLRSLPSGICDTLNVKTGEYVQRIGEVRITPAMMNSTEYGDDGNRSYLYFTPKVMNGLFPNRNVTNTEFAKNIMCAELPTIGGYGSFSPVLSVTQNEVVVIFKFPSSFSSETSNLNKKVDYIKNYVQKVGQLTFQYRLATPIIKTVDVQGFPYAYANGHVILSSGSIEQSLTPKVEYVVQTNRAGAIQANQDRLINHDKRLAMLEDLVLHQLIQLEYNRAKCTFLSQTRQIFEGGIQMYHTKYELLSEFIEKKLYRSLEEVFEMLDVYFMLGDITDGEYDALYEALMPSAEEIFEVEETFDHEDAEV